MGVGSFDTFFKSLDDDSGKRGKQWWKSEFKGSVTATDQRVADAFGVDPRTVANWRVHWKREGWKQPTKSDVK